MSDKKTNASDVVASIKEATTVDAVNEIIQDDTRKTVQEAATLKIAELEDVEETVEDVADDSTSESVEETVEDVADKKAAEAAKAKKANDKFLASQKGYEFNGKLYVFKAHTPPTLSLDGGVVKISDLLKDKKAMDALIKGGSGFIKRK